MTGYRLLVGNASAVLAGRLVAIVLGVVLATVLFRTLGAQQYGIWSLLTLISGYSTLIDFGMSAAIEQRVAALTARHEVGLIPGTLTVAALLLGVLTGVAQVLVMVFLALPAGRQIDSGVRAALLVLPVCSGVTLVSLAVGAVLAGQQRLTILQAWRTLGHGVGTAAVVAAAWAGHTSLAVLLILYATGSVMTIALAWRSLRGTMRLRSGPRLDREALHDLLGFGGIIQGATMVPPLAEYAFRLIVGGRFGWEFAAVYDLAARAAIVLRSLAGALFTAMVPFAVQTERDHGTAGVSALIRLTSRYVALFILPLSAVLLAFSDQLMVRWLGEGQEALVARVARCFGILLLAHAGAAIAVPASMVGRALRRPHPEAIATALAFVGAVAAAPFAPSFEVAAGLLWWGPAFGLFLAWLWLTRTFGIEFLHLRDTAVALVVAAVALGAARALVAWGPGLMVLRLAGAMIFAVLLALAVDVSRPRGRTQPR
jgi:O-antigen/teichoic acid export membrane protein